MHVKLALTLSWFVMTIVVFSGNGLVGMAVLVGNGVRVGVRTEVRVGIAVGVQVLVGVRVGVGDQLAARPVSIAARAYPKGRPPQEAVKTSATQAPSQDE